MDVPGRDPKGLHELHDLNFAMGKRLKVPVAAAGKAWLSVWGDNQRQSSVWLLRPRQSAPRKEGFVHLRMHSLCGVDGSVAGGVDPSAAEATRGRGHGGRSQTFSGSDLACASRDKRQQELKAEVQVGDSTADASRARRRYS